MTPHQCQGALQVSVKEHNRPRFHYSIFVLESSQRVKTIFVIKFKPKQTILSSFLSFHPLWSPQKLWPELGAAVKLMACHKHVHAVLGVHTSVSVCVCVCRLRGEFLTLTCAGDWSGEHRQEQTTCGEHHHHHHGTETPSPREAWECAEETAKSIQSFHSQRRNIKITPTSRSPSSWNWSIALINRSAIKMKIKEGTSPKDAQSLRCLAREAVCVCVCVSVKLSAGGERQRHREIWVGE